MFEYKVIKTTPKEAEKVMNDMASEGWRVVSTCCYEDLPIRVIITFEKEKDNFYK